MNFVRFWMFSVIGFSPLGILLGIILAIGERHREKYLMLMLNYSKTLRIRDLFVEISNCDHEDRTQLRYGGFIMLTAFINFVTRKQEYSGVTNNLRFQVLGGFK